MATVADKLRDALSLIKQYDWSQEVQYSWGFSCHSRCQPFRSFDVIGVCRHVASDKYAHMLIGYLCNASNAKTYLELQAWNDDSARTKDDVISLFTKAIKLAEGG